MHLLVRRQYLVPADSKEGAMPRKSSSCLVVSNNIHVHIRWPLALVGLLPTRSVRLTTAPCLIRASSREADILAGHRALSISKPHARGRNESKEGGPWPLPTGTTILSASMHSAILITRDAECMHAVSAREGTHTLSLSLSRARALSRSLSLCLSRSLSHTHTLTQTHPHTHA